MPSLPGPSQSHTFGDAIYREFFGGYADEMYLHDAQGMVLDVNQSACDNTGYTRQELIGMRVSQLSAQHSLARLQQLWATYPVGKNLVTANRHRRKDGSIYHLDVHLTCQMHEGHKYFLAVGRCTDQQRSHEREIERLNQRLQTLVDERTRQLKESTRLLEAVMQQIPDAVFIKDLQGRYVYGNPSLARQLGQPLERILGSTDAELLQPAAAAASAESDRLTLQRQEAGLFELSSGLAGVAHIFNVMKAPYRDDSGATVGLLGIARDITQVRQAEIEMAHNYEMLRQAERVARIGSWTLDLASNTFTASEMLTQMNGLQPHDPPLTPQTLASMIPPHEHALLGAAIGECIQHGTPYTIDVHHKRPGGGTFPGRIRGQAYRNAQGSITMLHGTLQDLTEHVEAEERLQTLADNLPNGAIFRCEQAGHDRLVLRYVSAGIHALLGVTAQGLIAHQSMFVQLVYEEDRKEFFRAMYSAMQAQTPFVHVCRMLHADGQTRWTRTRAISRRNHHAVYWEGILLDITAEHEAQRALHAAKEAAEAGERAKSEFLATMSHEIRTPMNTVIGMTQLLQQTPMSPKQRNYLNKVSLSATALLKIINEILDFSKLEAEMLHIDHEPFALDELLESVVTVTGLQAEQKGVEMVYNVAASVPRHLVGDVQRLGQVLTNLVGNAIKFTDRGEVVISLHAQPVPHTQQDLELHVTVRDTGIGIHPEHMQQLFQPFTQAEAHISRRFGGTGLGLAISHKLVQLMQGDIAVHSQLGHGSTFSFHVRLQAQAMAPLRKHLGVPQCRVLVVDDNLMAREMLSTMVRNFGLDCEVASSGAQALALLHQAQQSQQAFELVLMDWKMPGMDGLETAQRIRQDARLEHTPAMLMVTAYCRDEVLERVSDLQMQGLLIKPVTESVLLNAIQEALQLQTSHQPQNIDSPQPPQHPLLHIPANLQGRRVLVVDDNCLNREVAQDFLELANVLVTTASSGREALALLEQEHFDAVLLDVQMPEMDGLEVARRIRQDARWQDLPIWALTAQAREEDRRAIVASGMHGQLSKPINAQLLFHTLEKALAHLAEAAPPRAEQPPPLPPVAHEADTDGLTRLARHLGDQPERTQRLLQAFVRDFGQAPTQLLQLHQQQDWPALGMLAHTLKGALGYLAQPAALQAMESLEWACHHRQVTPQQVHSASHYVQQVLQHIAHHLQALCAQPCASRPPRGDSHALMAQIAQALPAIRRGEYAGIRTLERVEAQLRHSALHGLAARALALTEDLETEAACDCLQQLHQALAQEASDSAAPAPPL